MQGSREAAGLELSASLGAGCPCTPCQPERCHLPADSGGYSHNRNITLPSRAARLTTLPVSQSALMQPDIYLYIYISSATDPQAYLQDGVSAQPSCLRASVTSQPRQQGQTRGRGAGPSLAASSPHPAPQGPAQGSNDPGDPATQAASHQEQPQPSDTSQHEASLSERTGAAGCCS